MLKNYVEKEKALKIHYSNLGITESRPAATVSLYLVTLGLIWVIYNITLFSCDTVKDT